MRLNIITGASGTGFNGIVSLLYLMIQGIVMRVIPLTPRFRGVEKPAAEPNRAVREISGLATVWSLLVVLAAIAPLPIRAQTSASTAALPANRYLLVVETSHAMQKRAEGTLRTVNDLIASRMRGQLRLSDTIGVWTFNETLYAGKLPLQEWSEGGRSEIADKILNFLQEQKYEKQGRLDKLLPAVLKVVKNSEFITIVLISEGAQDFHGTPFDQRINQLYKQWTPQQQKARMPFVTVLRAHRGQFANYSVTPAPWPVDLTPLPAELLKPKASPSLAVASAPKPTPPPMAQPLIISGRKPEPTPVAPPATTNLVPPPATNSGLGAQSPAPTTNSEPAPQVTQSKIQPEAAQIPSAPDQGRPASVPATTAIAVQPPPAILTPVSKVESTSPAKLPQESLPTASPPVAQPIETKSVPDGSSPNLPSSKADQPVEPKKSQDAPAPEIAAAPGASVFSPTKLIALALVLAGSAAGAGVWLWKRRSRPPAHVSLITRSLDRDKH